MDENLVGYLLNALEPDEHRQVERYLEERPEARRHLELLRHALQPLALDRDLVEPPADLASRTVARARGQAAPQILPSFPSRRGVAPPRSWWRRADVLVAASLLLLLGLLLPPGLSYLHSRQHVVRCQNNLRVFYTALQNYSKNGEFPNVASVAGDPHDPHNVAGMVVPVLQQRRLLPADFRLQCRQGGDPVAALPSLEDLRRMEPAEFERYADRLLGCYSYALGYQDGAGFRGFRYDPEDPNSSYLPLLADRPPMNVATGDPGNSPNHGGRGQNVLFSDGHCRFCTTRNVGVNGDDIYLNEDREVAAGKHRWDAVLGESRAHPLRVRSGR